MEKIVEAIVQKHYGVQPLKIDGLGGGFYGRVYLASISKEPYQVILKVYLFPGFAAKEAAQLKLLAAHALVTMPEVFFVHAADKDIPNDILAMEYLPGINAGSSNLVLPEQNRTAIASVIVDNLLSYHKTVHKEGFGNIDGSVFYPDWQSFYRARVESTMDKAKKMVDANRLESNVLRLMDKAAENFDRIFYIPITEARLIHGDYNTWNIMLEQDLSGVKAIIDPFNCCWADSELDLYQLDNANGKYYGLLSLYASRCQLSENFRIKNNFYMLFTEITHYYDSGVDVAQSLVQEQMQALQEQMIAFGIAF